MTLASYQTLFAKSPKFAQEKMRECQQNAFAEFMRLGFPCGEAWKYLRLTELATFKADVVNDDEPNEFSVPPKQRDCFRLVFVNGYLQQTASDLIELMQECYCAPLSAAALEKPELIESAYTQLSDQDGFQAMNSAFATTGICLQIPKNTILSKPIHLLFLTNGPKQQLNACRHIIELGERAVASILEEYQGGEMTYFTNTITQINLLNASKLIYSRIQRENDKAFHIGLTEVNQARGSEFISHALNIGGLLSRNDFRVMLNAEHAQCELNGLYATKLTQVMDQHTEIQHVYQDTRSQQLYKGLLLDQSKAIFNGKITIHPDAQRCKAQQLNKNLLLSAQAEIDSKPELEIFADDVQCAHGATVGQLDDTALFYLQSRGIEEHKAKQLLVAAFADDILSRMENASECTNLIKEVCHLTTIAEESVC